MAESTSTYLPASTIPVPLVALAGWMVPGLGYLLIGERARGLIAGITILTTFVAGILIGGIRVVDVPGYDNSGQPRMLVLAGRGESVSAFRVSPLQEVMNKPWYIAQVLVGPVNVAATWASLSAAASGHRQSTARIFDIGTLYTSVAGMLNLLALIDAAHRAGRPREIESDDPGAQLRQVDDRILTDAAAVAAAVSAQRGRPADSIQTGGPA